jgi:hypothetical protein
MTVAHTDRPKSGRNGRTSIVSSSVERIPRLAKGGVDPENTRGAVSCAKHEKWITSLAAIIAPNTATVARGALVSVALARPARRSRCNANAKRGT